MMKINTFQMEQQEKQFARDLSYEEWVRENIKPLTNNDLNRMERENKVFIIKKPSIFPYPINTYNYQPLKGA